LGQQGNPLVAASAALLPVEGNSVNAIRKASGYSIGDFMANAISYQTPTMSGFTAKAAYSLTNQVDDTSGGSAWAANAFYNYGGLDITAGYNQQTSISNVAGASTTAAYVGNANSSVIACTNTISSTVAPCDLSSNAVVNNAKFLGNLKGYVVGAKYKISPTFSVGYGFAHADYDSGTAIAQVNGAPARAYNSSTHLVGLGYQAAPNLLLGLNYGISNLDVSFYNVQVRYSLSKRSTLYTQITMARNGAGSYQAYSGNAGQAFGNLTPVQTDTSGAPSAVQGYGGLPNTTQTAVSFGVIHSF
jgi:Gram-negative porin